MTGRLRYVSYESNLRWERFRTYPKGSEFGAHPPGTYPPNNDGRSCESNCEAVILDRASSVHPSGRGRAIRENHFRASRFVFNSRTL